MRERERERFSFENEGQKLKYKKLLMYFLFFVGRYNVPKQYGGECSLFWKFMEVCEQFETSEWSI